MLPLYKSRPQLKPRAKNKMCTTYYVVQPGNPAWLPQRKFQICSYRFS